MSSKISLVIPHFPSVATDLVLDKCLDSFKGQYDELILISNQGMGYGPAVNLGLKYASGSFLVVCNNDIIREAGTLRDMPYQPGITVPGINPAPRDSAPRAIFCMPRWVYDHMMKEDGFFYDPRFETGYFEDDDLIRRLLRDKIEWFPQSKLWVEHLRGGGMTMKQMGEQRWFDINQKVFNDKWSEDTCS